MQYYLSKIPGQFYLWFAVIIFGASGSVTRKLTQLGAMQFMNGHNPISLCNVLFVGNICALGIMLMLYRTELTAKKIAQISRSEWVNLTIVAILGGALAPAAIFQALALAPVNSIILLGRLEVPIVLLLSIPDNNRRVGDPSRIRDELGWVPQIPTEQTVDDLLQYWRQR